MFVLVFSPFGVVKMYEKVNDAYEQDMHEIRVAGHFSKIRFQFNNMSAEAKISFMGLFALSVLDRKSERYNSLASLSMPTIDAISEFKYQLAKRHLYSLLNKPKTAEQRTELKQKLSDLFLEFTKALMADLKETKASIKNIKKSKLICSQPLPRLNYCPAPGIGMEFEKLINLKNKQKLDNIKNKFRRLNRSNRVNFIRSLINTRHHPYVVGNSLRKRFAKTNKLLDTQTKISEKCFLNQLWDVHQERILWQLQAQKEKIYSAVNGEQTGQTPARQPFRKLF